MTPIERRQLLLHRLALCCLLAVLAVTSLSAFVRLSKAGLDCSDWPACYGQEQQRLQQGGPPIAQEPPLRLAARLAHRVMAVTVLLLLIAMLMLCFNAHPPLREQGRLVLLLLILALLLAVLGRWSSEARLPAVAMGNLLGGFAMLALCVRLTRVAAAPAPAALRPWVGVGILLLTLQIGLGVLVNASFAGLSCTVGDCGLGSALQQSGWAPLNPWREVDPTSLPLNQPGGVLVQSLHRMLSWALMALLLALALRAWHHARRGDALCLLALLAAQVLAGWLMVWFGLPLGLALLHNLLAALLLATLVRLL